MTSSVKTVPSFSLFRRLVKNPQARHYRRLKNGVWLYLYLVSYSHPGSGKCVTTNESIAKDMGLSPETIASWLGELRKWHYISIDKQGQKHLIKINHWNTVSGDVNSSEIKSNKKELLHIKVFTAERMDHQYL